MAWATFRWNCSSSRLFLVQVLERREHCAHGTANDEDRFGFGNELQEFVAFGIVVEVPWFALFVLALYVN